jgi:hypothetical protein
MGRSIWGGGYILEGLPGLEESVGICAYYVQFM